MRPFPATARQPAHFALPDVTLVERTGSGKLDASVQGAFVSARRAEPTSFSSSSGLPNCAFFRFATRTASHSANSRGKEDVMSARSDEPPRESSETADLSGQLKLAIDTDDLEEVKRLMARHPELHRVPLGASNGPALKWAAFGGGPPSETRLALAQWMIENGSDVHQGDDGPLIRALADPTFRMAELLVAHGADVNARYGGTYPIIMFPLEEFGPQALTWPLDHGADLHAAAKYCCPVGMLTCIYTRRPKAK